MFKNVASQSIAVYAYDSATGQPKTADGAQILVYVTLDWGTVNTVTSNSGVPTQIDATKAPGLYKIALSQGETNGDVVMITGKSTTSGIYISPQIIYTDPPNANLLSIDGSGRVDVAKAAGTAWASGAITSGVFAAGAIDASAIAADAIGSSELAASAINEIADGILDRDMSTGTDSGSTTVRTARQALRVLRNKVSISAGTATVCKEDDSTTSWTAAVTTDASANPITAVDPAGP